MLKTIQTTAMLSKTSKTFTNVYFKQLQMHIYKLHALLKLQDTPDKAMRTYAKYKALSIATKKTTVTILIVNNNKNIYNLASHSIITSQTEFLKTEVTLILHQVKR